MTAKLMMYKTSMNLNLQRLIQCAPDALHAKMVAEVLLALGSNYQADRHLPHVRNRLAALGEVTLSTAFQNPDFTATLAEPKPDYTNQCVHLILHTPMSLQQVQQTFKQLEGDCYRQRAVEAQTAIKQVTMDIDVLLIKTVFDKNSLSKSFESEDTNWIIMRDRYPFRTHEVAGVSELQMLGHVII